ncbi:MAG: restriction endonuclease [Clostridiaceae bacterium]|nr:restriction endonuclease [Clostridiaceae bacterium]
MELLENYYTDNYGNFDEWFDLIKQDEDVYPRFRIPYEEWLEEYTDTIDNKTEDEVKELLRHLLFPFTRGIDKLNYDSFYNYSKNVDKINDSIRAYSENLKKVEMYRRIQNCQEAWEGLTWVLQLLPFQPYKAIKSLNLYLESEVGYMPDDRIIGIKQSIAIIEAKFIYTNIGLENHILQLKPIEFEWLIEILYKDIGYETMLTPATRDGGKDIIAQIDREDGKEKVYVECKLYKTTRLTNEAVRAFGFSVFKGNVSRGILFCTGYVNKKLREIDSRIQIWSLEEIILLLNAHIGSDWHKRLELLIENQRRKYQR